MRTFFNDPAFQAARVACRRRSAAARGRSRLRPTRVGRTSSRCWLLSHSVALASAHSGVWGLPRLSSSRMPSQRVSDGLHALTACDATRPFVGKKLRTSVWTEVQVRVSAQQPMRVRIVPASVPGSCPGRAPARYACVISVRSARCGSSSNCDEIGDYSR